MFNCNNGTANVESFISGADQNILDYEYFDIFGLQEIGKTTDQHQAFSLKYKNFKGAVSSYDLFLKSRQEKIDARPKRGVAGFVREKFLKVTKFIDPVCEWFTAKKITFFGTNILVISVYLPTCNETTDSGSKMFGEVLDMMANLIFEENVPFIAYGDLNYDAEKHQKNVRRVAKFKKFLNDTSSVHYFPEESSYYSNRHGSYSSVDGLIVSRELEVTRCITLGDDKIPGNNSDHSPVAFSVKVPSEVDVKFSGNKKPEKIPHNYHKMKRCNWNCVDKNIYAHVSNNLIRICNQLLEHLPWEVRCKAIRHAIN